MADDRRGGVPMADAIERALKAPGRAVFRMLANPETTEPVGQDCSGTSAIIDCALYIDGVRQPGDVPYPEALRRAERHDNAFVWIGLHDPSADEFTDIADTFDLHELAVEDAVNAAERPKVERYGAMTFLVVRAARYVEHTELTATTEVVDTGDVMFFIGQKYVISVRHGDACRLGPVRKALEARRELLTQGPWAVYHAVVDSVVDTYLDVASAMESDIDTLEESVFGRNAGDVQRAYQLKRELVEFRRAALPLQRPLASLVAGEIADVPDGVRHYIRNVADHLSRVIEQLGTFDDLLNSILQVRLAQVTVEQNNDMRKIAAWAAIVAVQTTIAGIYGMNFKHMPELDLEYGYYAAVIVMVGIAAVLYRAFRKSGWL